MKNFKAHSNSPQMNSHVNVQTYDLFCLKHIFGRYHNNQHCLESDLTKLKIKQNDFEMNKIIFNFLIYLLFNMTCSRINKII